MLIADYCFSKHSKNTNFYELEFTELDVDKAC